MKIVSLEQLIKEQEENLESVVNRARRAAVLTVDEKIATELPHTTEEQRNQMIMEANAFLGPLVEMNYLTLLEDDTENPISIPIKVYLLDGENEEKKIFKVTLGFPLIQPGYEETLVMVLEDVEVVCMTYRDSQYVEQSALALAKDAERIVTEGDIADNVIQFPVADQSANEEDQIP